VLRKVILSMGCATLLMTGACNRDYDRGMASDSAPAGSASDLDARGQDFVQKAAVANIAEVELGQLATQRAEHADVKRFARMMVDDHSKALDELTTAASQGGVQVTRTLDEKHREIHQRLSSLQGKEFDREYMKVMVEGHEEAAALLEHRAERAASNPAATTSGGTTLNTDVDQWAAKTLPQIRSHLEQAKQIRERL